MTLVNMFTSIFTVWLNRGELGPHIRFDVPAAGVACVPAAGAPTGHWDGK